ncbi:MAG TPA: hypothetical protein VF319_04240 [Caldimonas sp.]
MLRRLPIAAMALTATFASVAQFDELGDIKGSTIAYAGAFETVYCPIGGKYNCMTWPENLLRTNGNFCFATSAFNSCTSICQGVLAAGADRRVQVFLFDLGSVKKGDVRPTWYPDVF